MNRSSMLSRFLFLGGFRVSGDPSDEAGMVENFGDGELRETFQFHLQYYGYLSIKTSDKLTEFHQSFGISIRLA
ncbi:unnamed protein product [Brassica oleracea]